VAPGRLPFVPVSFWSVGRSKQCGRGSEVGTTGFTVGLWRNRFIAEGVGGLGDEARPGAPREIGDEKVEQVVRLTLEKTPKGATHWSSRMLAARTGLSQSTISRIWRAFGLKPHRTESFQLSNDPLLIDKVRDIVGSISIHPIMRWCCALMRSRRFRRSAYTAGAAHAGWTTGTTHT
jgi:transposase